MLNNIVALLDAGVAASTNSYESIYTVPVTSAVSSISFTSIPSTYKHLQIRLMAGSTGVDAGLLTFNSDTGANYTRHRLTGNGSAAGAGAGTGQTAASINSFGGYPDTANTFGVTIIDILDYTNTNKYTTIRSLSGEDMNGSGFVEFTSNLWLNTAAITRIDYAALGGNWKQYSSFALYGIKG
jgi:hypothetical protein